MGAAEAVSEGTRKIHFSETKHAFCLNRFQAVSFQALAVKEGRRRKESQREELFSVISDTVQGSFGQRSSAG